MPASPDRLPAQAVSESFIHSKLQYMVDLQLWPNREKLDYIGWLDNFSDTERPFALNLLNVFIYFNDDLVNALFRSAAQALSAEIVSKAASHREAQAVWQDYLSRVKISYVEGENPSVTDSGLLFARKARQILEIDEKQIVEPQVALRELLANPNIPVLLLDDFVGGGSQMKTTWRRPYPVDGKGDYSFAEAALDGASLVYAPLIATSKGEEALAIECPELTLRPAHVLGPGYSLTDSQCVLWPEHLKSDALDFLYNASKRAGIVDGYQIGWKGFHDLALAIGFAHSIPDATLPLFYWDQNDWAPLIRRT